MNKKYTFEDFIKIIETLRSENGCPWDKEQTHESLKPCVMEEAAELTGAIRIYSRTGNAENMREELGDLLLQVVMHSQIAEEEELFTIEDVIQEVSEKMIRRHPHVFGDTEADNTAQVLLNWEEIKKKEKEGKSWIESPLREIPRELPSLTRAPKVIKKIDRLYEKAPDAETAAAAVAEEAAILQSRIAGQKSAAEIGDAIGSLLWDVSNIIRQFGLSSEQILTDRIDERIEQYEPSMK